LLLIWLSPVEVREFAVSHYSLTDRDELQTELDDGPCLRAVWEQQTVRIPDMATESRWPRFAAAAIHAGVGAMLCFQLFVEGDNLGALNLYGATAGATPCPHGRDRRA